LGPTTATTRTTESSPVSPHLSPDAELALLLCCARISPTGDTRNRIETLARGPLDWNRFYKTACARGVAPLVYTTLLSRAAKSVPDRILTALQAYFHQQATFGKFRALELLRLLDLFQENGVRAIAYKGPVLAEIAYGSLTLREFQDVDILVGKQEIFRARDLLLAEGYRWCEHYPNPFDVGSLDRHHAFSFIHDQLRCSVDLHWRLSEPPFDRFCLDIADLSRRAEKRLLLGKEVLSLCREDLLLCLCFHAAKHHWAQLKWLCDLAELVNRNHDLDWETVWKRAEISGRGLTRLVALNLTLASTLLGAQLPAEVAERVSRDAVAASLAGTIRAKIVAGKVSSRYAVDALFLQLHEGQAARVSYFLKRAKQERLLMHIVRPTPGDREFVRLPRWLSPLYFLIRPFRVFGVYGMRPLRWCVSLLVGRRES
jgi:hypothetical protein